MIKVTTDVNGVITTHVVDSMDALAKLQGYLTESAKKDIKPEISEEDRARIIKEFFEDVEQGVGLYDFVDEIENNMPRAFDELIERALRDTDYSNIDEISEDMDRLKSAMEDIYSITRDWC